MPSEQAQKFLDWYNHSRVVQLDEVRVRLIEMNADTPDGRVRLAQSYVNPANELVHRAISETYGSATAVSNACLEIEWFISLFPENERLISPLVALRVALTRLYGYLSFYTCQDTHSQDDEGLELACLLYQAYTGTEGVPTTDVGDWLRLAYVAQRFFRGLPQKPFNQEPVQRVSRYDRDPVI